jgi:methionine-rich copper-binding protein CopC
MSWHSSPLRQLGFRLSACLLAGTAFGVLLMRPPAPVQAQAPLPGPAQLVLATPPDGAVLATAPARIDMIFDKDLADQSKIHVFDDGNARVDRDDGQVDGKGLTIGVRDLPPGRYQVRWLAVNDLDRTQARGGYTFQIDPAAAGQPQLAVSPASTDAGQMVTIAGSGFPPNALVVVAIGDNQRGMGTPSTDPQGRFILQTTVPAYLPHGRQVIQAVDLAGNMATAALAVEQGGWPPLGIRMTLERPEEGGNFLHVEVHITNRSGWDLRRIIVSASVPEGTRVLAEGLGGPDGTTNEVTPREVHWRDARARPHTIMDAFAYNISTAGLPPGSPYPQPTVSVRFDHSSEPIFRGLAQAVALLPGQRLPPNAP